MLLTGLQVRRQETQRVGGFQTKERSKTAATERRGGGSGPFVLPLVSLSHLNFVKPWGKQGEAGDGAWRGAGARVGSSLLFQSSGERQCRREVPGELFLHKNVLLLREKGLAWNLVSPGTDSDPKTPFKPEAALCLTVSAFLVFLSRFHPSPCLSTTLLSPPDPKDAMRSSPLLRPAPP